MKNKKAEAIANLSTKLGLTKVLSSGPLYDEARRVWNRAISYQPIAIVRCQNTSDVQTVVDVATSFGLSLSVRGGGHDWAGRAMQGDLVIDLSEMRDIHVEGREATIGGGATSMDVAMAAASHGLAPVTGNLGAVGMAGLTLGGGYGPLTGAFGMASDNLIGAEVVTADGEVIVTDETHEPDLLWALRGGGGNFGVATALRVKLHPVADLSAGTVSFPWSQTKSVAQAFGQFQLTAPDELTLTTAFAPGPDGALATMMLYAWCGGSSQDDYMLDIVKGLGESAAANVSRTSYVQMLKDADVFVVPDLSTLYRTVTLANLHPGAIHIIVTAMEKRSSPLSYIVLHPFHGAAERVPLESNAFGLRSGHFVVGIYAFWQDGEATPHHAWADAVESALTPFALPNAYPNYFGPDRPEQAARAYGQNAARLMQIKSRYDAKNLFKATALPI